VLLVLVLALRRGLVRVRPLVVGLRLAVFGGRALAVPQRRKRTEERRGGEES
jgi:hypothetical protein